LASTGTYFAPTLTIFEQIAHAGDPAYLARLTNDAIITADEARAVAARPSFGAPFPHHPQAETLARFRYGMRILPLMRDAGVKIVAGSDVGLVMSRPAALLRELQLLADAGLAPGDVIVAASRHAAEKIGKGAVAGTIAPGQIADAVLVDANPLADIMHLIRPSHRVATLRRGRLAVAAPAE
jgi:imidazolonepropionase-like amidohydrolase